MVKRTAKKMNPCSLLAFAILLGPTAAAAQDEVVYYHTDAIGSVRMVTDAAGAVIARYDYLPFGERFETVPPATYLDQRQFAGKERDLETGLDYFGARYLRGQSGRFITTDPVLNIEAALIDPQRWNRYGYARNNPFAFIDPDGRDVYLVLNPHRMAANAAVRNWISEVMGMNQPDPHPHARVGRVVMDSVLSMFFPQTPHEMVQASNAAVLGSASALETGGLRVISGINRDKTLVRLAEDAGRSVQSGIDKLTTQLAQGNLNPGIGTKNLFGDVMYARASDGARVFFRKAGEVIEILAKASKHNEESVIRRLTELYR
jgi:RHS repeat-associated protein